MEFYDRPCPMEYMHLGELRDLARQLVAELGDRRRRSPAERQELVDRTRALLTEFSIRAGTGAKFDPRETPEFVAGRGDLVSGFVNTYELHSRDYRWWLVERALRFIKLDLGPDHAHRVKMDWRWKEEGNHGTLREVLTAMQQRWVEARNEKRLAESTAKSEKNPAQRD